MSVEAYITLSVILGAVILFVTEWLSIDLVALLIVAALILTGVITPVEGVMGFSNTATLTVAFMFVLSAALLKTGALQFLAHRISRYFRDNSKLGLILMMGLIALVSAFVNNTPVVTVFIPVVMQVAIAADQDPKSLLIPLSYASILGGTCTLIGTSTNILVSGIAESQGQEPFSMFEMLPVGIILVVVGILYMAFIGIKLLPKKKSQESMKEEFGHREYLTQIQLMKTESENGVRIMDASWVKELGVAILEVKRKHNKYSLPPGDFILKENDVLKVHCKIDRLKTLADKLKILNSSEVNFQSASNDKDNLALVELVISPNATFVGQSLKQVDFRGRYRAYPIAIKADGGTVEEDFMDIPLNSGDVVLAEVKKHYVPELQKMEAKGSSPFILLSEQPILSFKKTNFFFICSVIASIILAVTFNVVGIMEGTLYGVIILVLTRMMTMKEVYEAIHWKIVFLLAGALSLGLAMHKTELDVHIAGLLTDHLGQFGPYVLISGLYIMTSLLTEIMSNNATAALLTPIAITTAYAMGLHPLPFLITVTIAASASFMTPIGYQTNSMVYAAGQYKFSDFLKVGAPLNLILWILCSFLIPYFYGF